MGAGGEMGFSVGAGSGAGSGVGLVFGTEVDDVEEVVEEEVIELDEVVVVPLSGGEVCAPLSSVRRINHAAAPTDAMTPVPIMTERGMCT